MKRWLVKSDPEEYAAGDLERDGRATWDGVSNALAQQHLRAMSVGDGVLVYHTGKEKAVVAEARVAGPPVPDPTNQGGKLVVVELAFMRWLPRAVPLAEIKADPAFDDFALVRIGRLSVMPVTVAQWNRILKLTKV